jgi:RNA polymerase-associated protein RTF1
MADLDDDLLDLAGGDSGDEGSVSEGRDRSASPPAKKKQAKKSRGRSGHDDSEEEGEA